MEIIPSVNFVLKMIEPVEYKYRENLNMKYPDFTFATLQSEIANCIGLVRKVPCAFDLMRKVSFRTADYHKLGEDITTDNFKFIIADKVPYLSDLQKYLLDNFSKGTEPCQDVHFKNMAQFDESKPIFFTGPYEYNGSFLPDAPLDKRPLTARPLTSKDIVLDKKLNQIWPVATNKPPKELIALLAKTKEEIR